MELSAGQVNRAGKVLRDAYLQGAPMGAPEVREALAVLAAFKDLHEAPLAEATNHLRDVVRDAGYDIEVSHRMKRTATIIDKLARQPTLKLARMQDIGGCRAVVADLAELRRLQERLTTSAPPLKVSDYVERPRSSGYRGVHLITAFEDRPIEIQLRMQAMHRWALTVEETASRIGADLKSGRGPAKALEWLATLADTMAVEDARRVAHTGDDRHHRRLEETAVAYATERQMPMRSVLPPLQHYLIMFDHDADELIEVVEFGTDSKRALKEYAARELEHLENRRMEVVLIGSDSLETVKRTHANYFGFTLPERYFDDAPDEVRVAWGLAPTG